MFTVLLFLDYVDDFYVVKFFFGYAQIANWFSSTARARSNECRPGNPQDQI